jgi:predicted Fe-Mo cluster-binding NifX family protein
MKVAVPVTRDERISAHFGRSPAFLILDLDQGQVRRRELRLNDQAGQEPIGAIHPHPAAGHDHGHGHPHDHGRFVQLLGDCHAVVGLGIGPGARLSLESCGIKVRILKAPCTPEAAALQFEAGALEAEPGPSCRH